MQKKIWIDSRRLLVFDVWALSRKSLSRYAELNQHISFTRVNTQLLLSKKIFIQITGFHIFFKPCLTPYLFLRRKILNFWNETPNWTRRSNYANEKLDR